MLLNKDLLILPLNTIDNLSYQKCILPKDKFPATARPGQWSKCCFIESTSGSQNYAIAQIFPRHDVEGACYMDASVTHYSFNDYQQLTLKECQLLENPHEIEQVNVFIKLNPEYFVKNSEFLTKTHLFELAKTFLQKYHFTHDSSIKDEFLLENGIDCISIQLDNYTEEGIYFVTDASNVIIKNISLTYNNFKRERLSLNVEPFAIVLQELQDLIKFVRMQRSQKRSLNMSLNALVVGPVGCGKTTLVEEFLQSHHCNIFRIEIGNCLKQYPGETEAELRKIFKAAIDFEHKFKAKDPTVILLEELHLLCPQPTSTAGNSSDVLANSMRISAQLLSLVDALFTNRANVMCLATTSKPDTLNELVRRPGRFENEISIASLQEGHRKDILKELLNHSIRNFNVSQTILEKLAKQTQGYVIADLTLLVRKIAQAILTRTEEKQEFEEVIVDMLNKSKPISLKSSDVTAFKTTETFESIGGMLDLKKILEVSVLAGLKQEESFKRFGLSLPKGVLLYGPPGCAKTTIAKCLATEANMTFIATSGAEVYSPYVGCAEKFIGKIFQTARKNSPCLIFLDEIDSLVGRRSLASSGSNSGDVQVRILSTLLTEMDGVIAASGQSAHILVVAATNRPDMVDDALMRPGRFDKLIHVPAPDFLSRRSILDLYKCKMPFSPCVDLDVLAKRTENYSGADICNLCNEAAMQAFQRDFNCSEILMKDFESVLQTSKSSLIQSQIDWYYQFENKF
ncbi:spermatogenesis-associated protein 5-like protein 1 [Lucilia cuprina]|uniref:spermatogenesis-associated protein 5-like protein 1 n=1 Tax=Lucilia cuprina TaxID=7375 RepID=UPI001F06BD96|nr:spermatogenesis-associated protein 5-like protein 1 [Lucilia cuprina]